MGAWIETLMNEKVQIAIERRTLTWVRGLKHTILVIDCDFHATSHPYMGAWIETPQVITFLPSLSRTLTWVRGLKRSGVFPCTVLFVVAPLHGCVD